MRFLYSMLLCALCLPVAAGATTHTISNSGTSFTPATLSINLGDTVVFSLGTTHNAVEVSQATWNSNGNTPLAGGFSLPFGGGTVVPTATGTYYYVCSPHASLGMKGTITVTSTTISTGTIASASHCKGVAFNVPFTITGSFNAGNTFTAQLSDATGGFGTPRTIGTLSGTSSGQISATIPAVVTAGTGYRVRVVSSDPSVTGSDNGSDLTVLDVPVATITPAGPTAFCEGSSVQLDAPAGAGLTYTWRRDGSVITGAGGASYTATVAGQYTVEVSNGACAATSSAQRVIVYPADPTTLAWTGNIDSDWSTIGNWDNPCAVPSAGDTVVIGPGVTPPSSAPAIALGTLTLNNVSGLSLAGSLEISGDLTLSAGSISLGNADLVLGPAADINGAGTTRFIITDGSGELRLQGIGIGGRTGVVLFPVGNTAGSYTPVILQNGGFLDAFGVRVAAGVLDGGNAGTSIGSDVVGKTWFITEQTAGGSNASMTFEWSAGDELTAFDRSLCYVAHHDGSDWQQLQSLGASAGSDPYQRAVSGVTSFSPFAIGDGGSPLPVEYRTLSAEVHGSTIAIRWETEREINSRGFAVERSRMTQGPWSAVAFLDSRGDASRSAMYEYIDVPPAAGSWYYRLRQQDMDGSTELSPVLHAELGTPAAAGSIAIEAVWPNPLRHSTAGDVTVRFRSPEGGLALLTLHDILGRHIATIHENVMAGISTAVRFNTASLAPGLYFFRLRSEGTAVHSRLAIE
ncbi:MAG: hypothetical protein KFF77_08725 [Bacteroidetes bacterium]|nr:hypothetical protein [Bacteroidota bacterium]